MIEYLKRRKLFFLLLFVVYFLINALFVLKYGNRQPFVSKYNLLVLYFVVVVGGLFCLQFFKDLINRINAINYCFLGFSLLVFVVFIGITIFIDGNELNTDRWSAMEVTIRSILSNQFPYAVKDHLNQTSSNLPSLFYIGLPFYALGDVGLLQPFTFLCIAFALFRMKVEVYIKFLVLFLILISPAYLWEVFAKSDLISNIVLLVLFMLYWNNTYKSTLFYKTKTLAFFCAFFVLTRGVVVIPLVLFFFKAFLKLELKRKVLFLLSFMIFVLLLSFPVLITIPDIKTVIEHNPFNHQTRYSPKLLQVVFILLPFFIALKIESIQHVFKYTVILLTMLLFITFGVNVLEEGFEENLYGNLFDISYIPMILPFVIPLLFLKEKKFE